MPYLNKCLQSHKFTICDPCNTVSLLDTRPLPALSVTLGRTSLVLLWCCAHNAIKILYYCFVYSYLVIYIQIRGLLVVILALGRVTTVVLVIKLFVATRRLYCVMCANFGVTVNVLVLPTKCTLIITSMISRGMDLIRIDVTTQKWRR